MRCIAGHWQRATGTSRITDMKYNFHTDIAGNVLRVEASLEPRVDPVLFRKRASRVSPIRSTSSPCSRRRG
jgi:hypothetical protein